jgi:hypothetical protein
MTPRSCRFSPRAAAVARGAARARRRALGDGTTGAPSGRRRRAHTPGRLPCGTTARGGGVPRRRLVLPSPLSTRAGNDEAPRNRRRHTTSPASSAQRQPALRTPPAAVDSNRRADAARRSRPSRTPRHRPLDRRHPHHARQHLAMGRHRAEACSTISTLVESGQAPVTAAVVIELEPLGRSRRAQPEVRRSRRASRRSAGTVTLALVPVPMWTSGLWRPW